MALRYSLGLLVIGSTAAACAPPPPGRSASPAGRAPPRDEAAPMTLSRANFETIKVFVLERGDRLTYSNMYNSNPHYRFDGFDVYLNPEAGQRNINCDPALSDFDEIVIHEQKVGGEYFRVKRVGSRPELSFEPHQREALTRFFEQMRSAIARLR